jgi:CelD/BcsL family acetyltransferase involved in cellulose biosynthesis
MSGVDTLVLEVVDDVDGLLRLRQAWAEATAADPMPNVFLTWEWVHTWWRHFGAGNHLHVVVLRDRAGVVAIAPLQRSVVGVGPLRARLLQRLSPQAGDYGGIIVTRRHAEVIEVLTEHVCQLLRRRKVAAVELSRLASDDPVLELLRRSVIRRPGELVAHEQRLQGVCLFTDVADDGFDFAKQTKKHKVRQRLRRLEEAHDDVVFSYHSGPDLDRGMELLLAVHAARWAGREGEMQGLLADPARERFFLDAIRALDEQGRVRLLTLTADGRPVAAELDFELHGRLFMFKGAIDPDFAPFSPGQLLHHRTFSDGMADGVGVFDFGRGDQDYKRRWATGERHLVTTTVIRAGAAGRLAARRLRAARAVELRLRRDAAPAAPPAPAGHPHHAPEAV